MVNSLYNYPTHMVFFTTPELLEIGGMPMTSLNEKPGRTEALKYYRRVAEHYKLDIHQYERVLTHRWRRWRLSRPHQQGEYRARKIVLATGYYDVPNMLNVPGEELDKVIHYYKEPHPYYNHDVMVVGAKNSAAIAALELFWTGARVTLVHRGAGIPIASNIGSSPISKTASRAAKSRRISIRACSRSIPMPWCSKRPRAT